MPSLTFNENNYLTVFRFMQTHMETITSVVIEGVYKREYNQLLYLISRGATKVKHLYFRLKDGYVGKYLDVVVHPGYEFICDLFREEFRFLNLIDCTGSDAYSARVITDAFFGQPRIKSPCVFYFRMDRRYKEMDMWVSVYREKYTLLKLNLWALASGRICKRLDLNNVMHRLPQEMIWLVSTFLC